MLWGTSGSVGLGCESVSAQGPYCLGGHGGAGRGQGARAAADRGAPGLGP